MWAECFPGRKDELANDFEIHYISHIKKRNERKKKKIIICTILTEIGMT